MTETNIAASTTNGHEPDYAGLEVRPLAGHIGAEIHGIDISQPLDEAAVEGIRRALDRWRVVFFRNQELDHSSQIAFGRQFGELTYAHPHDELPPEGYQEIYTVEPGRQRFQYGINPDDRPRPRRQQSSFVAGWHTDVTPAVNPPAGSILRADVIPPYGGDTTFTSMVAAYEGLSEPVQRFVDTLRAEHRYGANPSGVASRPYRERFEERPLVANHPVVRVHPRTGEKGLFVSPTFTDHILDVSPLESRWILDHLFLHMTRPEYTVRFKWEPGSVAFWDNRATAHLGPQDIEHLRVERVLHRVTLIGDVPVGPDGRESELVAGVPFRSDPLFTPTPVPD
jgi:alpha-ketoglutarate-dependent sulfate ester dioxygenase